MANSKDMIDFFVEEIHTLRAEMSLKVSKVMQGKLGELDLSYFAEFGQMIDRIYGTAATLGYEEIATYTKHLKDVCYMFERRMKIEGARAEKLGRSEFFSVDRKSCK